MKKIYLLLILCALHIVASATQYFPNAVTAPYSGTPQSVCLGSTNATTTVNYTVCGTTLGGTSETITPMWYLNSTLVYIGTAFTSTTGGGTVTLPAGVFTYSSAGTFTGANGLKCVLTWTTVSPGACGSTTSVTGTATNVTVNSLPLAITGPSSVCIGGSTALTDPSGTGTWTSGATTVATVGNTSGIVYGVSLGLVNITFTLSSTGCIAVRTLGTVAPPTAIYGATNVCPGLSVTLSSDVTGGTWSSSNNTIATVDSVSGVVTGTAPGAVVISYSNGCGTPTHAITVNTPPANITGPSSVCIGSTARFSDATVGGTWSVNSSSIATIGNTSGIATGLTAGVVTITYTGSTTCVATKTLAVNPPPQPISGPTQVCAGLTITLSDGAPVGVWTTANTTVATVGASTGVVTGVSAGTAVISFSNSCGPTTTRNITVNPLPQPIAGVYSACNGLTTILSDADAGGIWTSSNTTIATIVASGTAAGFVTGIAPGVVNITYTLPTTCIMVHSLTVTPPSPPTAIVGANTVCDLQNITLSQETGVGVWTSINTSLATVDRIYGIVTGVSMGVDTIVYTIGTGPGCTTFKTVTVYPLAPITGPDSICMGAPTYLADIVGGGTWTSSFLTTATIGSANGFVTPVTPGTTTISYTTPLGCVITKPLRVITIPGPITGVLRTCPGDFVTLSNADIGGAWSSSNPGIATVNPSNGRVYGVFPDTVTIIYTLRPGCTSDTQIVVNPNPAPITGPHSMCIPNVDTLYDTTPGGVWSSVFPSLATITSTGVVTAVSGGNALIYYTLPITGCKAKDTIVIHPLPNPTITYNKFTATLYTETYFSSYQWYDDFQGLIPGANSSSLAALYTENYWVIVTDTFGCINSSAHYPFDATLLGLNNISPESVKIYPNPVNNTLYINAPVKLKAIVTGVDGRIIMTQENATAIDVSHFADGMYFITLYNDNKLITTRKFTKQ